METRKIIIMDSSTNQSVVVNTDATTFGELKKAAIAAGINSEGKDWLEGITKTTPVSDDSLLPTNVPYKGTITNNLVYMLTNTNKKIKSGMDRKELYAEIKNNNLSDEFKTRYNKHFTNASTAQLQEFVDSFKKGANIERKAATEKKASKKEICKKDSCDMTEVLLTSIASFVATLPSEAKEKLMDILQTTSFGPQEVEFSDSELRALFRK